MKTDKELLMLAAKAAGIHGVWNEPCCKFEKLSHEGWCIGFFEPLTDDGDALRLAVKLNISVRPKYDCCFAYFNNNEFVNRFCELYGGFGDQFTATRRAIVIAAAAIGEKL